MRLNCLPLGRWIYVLLIAFIPHLLTACGGSDSSAADPSSNLSSTVTAPSSVARTTVMLPQFAIKVTHDSPRSITVTWTPPTDNEDGSALTNLAGYRVYYGTDPNNLADFFPVKGADQTAYELPTLDKGEWYFAVTAVTSEDVESTVSNTVSVRI